MRYALMAVVILASAGREAAQETEAWTRPTPAVQIVGNFYYVGTFDLASYLITTDEGHILINTGVASSTPLITSSIESLGFRFSDIKVLLATHAHWDHVAALAEIKRLTGARLLMHQGDVPSLEDGGRSDFRFGSSPNTYFEPVQVDQALTHGDEIRLGSTVLTLHHHPGHTKGASSFTFTARQGDRDYRVLIANMGTINPGVTVSGMASYPQIREDYARTFSRQQALTFDIWVASHASQFGLHDKAARAGGPERFIDPDGYRASVAELEAAYLKQLATEGGRGGRGSAAPQAPRASTALDRRFLQRSCGWRRTGRPARRAGDARDKRFVPSTKWGCPATGPALGAPRRPATVH